MVNTKGKRPQPEANTEEPARKQQKKCTSPPAGAVVVDLSDGEVSDSSLGSVTKKMKQVGAGAGPSSFRPYKLPQWGATTKVAVW